MSFDIDKYKRAWQSEDKFEEDILSESDIRHFIQAGSTSILLTYRKSLVFDLVFKLVLTFSFCFLIVILKDLTLKSLNFIFVLVTIFGIAYQWNTYRKVPASLGEMSSAMDTIQSLLNFHKRYSRSIFVSALSSALLFISGSMIYLHLKYGVIPKFQWDDAMVMGTGIILSYVFSAYSQWRHVNQMVEEWEMYKSELENDTFNEQHMQTFRKKRTRNLIIYGLLLLGGLLLLLVLFFLFKS